MCVCVCAAVGFARQTGDLRALSRVDLRVIALTYMLERQETGAAHLRTEPVRKVRWMVDALRFCFVLFFVLCVFVCVSLIVMCTPLGGDIAAEG